jgi:hypothetical protein
MTIEYLTSMRLPVPAVPTGKHDFVPLHHFSTSNAISFLQGRTEHFVRRL